VLQRGNVDRRELVIPESEALTLRPCQECVTAPLHLNRRLAELPNGKAVQNRGLAGVVSTREESHALGPERDHLVLELLEPVEGDFSEHLQSPTVPGDAIGQPAADGTHPFEARRT
jgi:hypothetical protein